MRKEDIERIASIISKRVDSTLYTEIVHLIVGNKRQEQVCIPNVLPASIEYIIIDELNKFIKTN